MKNAKFVSVTVSMLLIVGLAISVVPTVAGSSGNSNGASQAGEIEKIKFVHYQREGDGPSTADENEDDYKLIMGGAKWHENVSYEVNPDGSGLDNENLIDALDASVETWNDNANGLFKGISEDNLTEETVIGKDGTNRIVWSDLSQGVIAVSHLWIDSANKEIVESDVEFNTDYAWSTTGESGHMDLQNIATHEFGHNGLDDLNPPFDSELTMYAYSEKGETKKRSLGLGDELGMEDLY